MDLLDATNKVRHCYELAYKTNPLLKQFPLVSTGIVKSMALAVQPFGLLFNPQYFTENASEDWTIKTMLDMYEDYIAYVYPEETHAPSNTMHH